MRKNLAKASTNHQIFFNFCDYLHLPRKNYTILCCDRPNFPESTYLPKPKITKWHLGNVANLVSTPNVMPFCKSLIVSMLQFLLHSTLLLNFMLNCYFHASGFASQLPSIVLFQCFQVNLASKANFAILASAK